MELYKIGSILLDISIGLLVIGAFIRLFLTMTYFRRNKSASATDGSPSSLNGKRYLTDAQRETIRRAIRPISIIGLILAIASVIILFIS